MVRTGEDCAWMRGKKENMMLCFPLRFTYYLHKLPKSFSLLVFGFFYYFQEAKPCFKHPYPALFSTVKQVSSKIQREAKKLWTIHYYAPSITAAMAGFHKGSIVLKKGSQPFPLWLIQGHYQVTHAEQAI